MEVELKLTVEEVNGVLHALGELPTKTGAFSLAVKVKQQAEKQIPKPEEPKNEE